MFIIYIQFVSLDDDEFITEDEPIRRPPAMKDLSVYAESIPANNSNNTNNNRNQTANGSDDTEFDFL